MKETAREASRGPIDMPFLLLTLLLTSVGLIMLFSASFPSAYYETKNHDPTYYFRHQLILAVIGVGLMLFFSRLNYERLRLFAVPLLFFSVVLLVLVLIPGIGTGLQTHGAQRWIRKIGPFPQFQPSEVAKFGVILFFADSISKKKTRMATLRYGVAPYVLVLGVIGALMMKEPHLSGTLLILGIGAAMMFVGGIRWRYVLSVGGLGVLGVWGYLAGVFSYNQSRIAVWLDPLSEELKQGDAYQIRQSLLAIGSGGLLGVGLGKSRQKFLYLPEEHNDFIFAVICEELGLIGATLIMALFAILIFRGYWIALHARDRFGALLAVGVTTQVLLQMALNIAVVTNLIPNTGISLPFFSFGGTALAIQLVEMGVVLSVSRQMPPT